MKAIHLNSKYTVEIYTDTRQCTTPPFEHLFLGIPNSCTACRKQKAATGTMTATFHEQKREAVFRSTKATNGPLYLTSFFSISECVSVRSLTIILLRSKHHQKKANLSLVLYQSLKSLKIKAPHPHSVFLQQKNEHFPLNILQIGLKTCHKTSLSRSCLSVAPPGWWV